VTTTLLATTTLSDLAIFAADGTSAGVLDLIDRTTTSRGRAALRRRMAKPASDLFTLRRTQEAVRFLQDHSDDVRLSDPHLEAVSRYLRSNIVVSAGSGPSLRLEQAWMALRYRDLLKQLVEGVEATVTLFQHVARICESLVGHGAPPLIAELAMRLLAASETVLRARNGSQSLLQLDRVLRLEERRALEDALEDLGDIDALNAMATTTNALGWVIPTLVDAEGFQLEADGVYHPFVESPVGNPIRLSGGEPMVFLTGPNMAGKTTYLRSVGLVVLLGQLGMGVPARRARFTPVDALFTSLNPADNLRAGLSYFLVEVLRVKDAACILARGQRALVLFDEVFKGTNVRDAVDASRDVILGFAKARNSGFIFSSHLTELVPALQSNSAIRFCYFDGDLVQNVPRYTYRLRDGVSDKRFGLALLHRAGVPELLQQIGALERAV
jgi:DNA mismatch repair protein MutS